MRTENCNEIQSSCVGCHYAGECGFYEGRCEEYITEENYAEQYKIGYRDAFNTYVGYHSADEWYKDEQ